MIGYACSSVIKAIQFKPRGCIIYCPVHDKQQNRRNRSCTAPTSPWYLSILMRISIHIPDSIWLYCQKRRLLRSTSYRPCILNNSSWDSYFASKTRSTKYYNWNSKVVGLACSSGVKFTNFRPQVCIVDSAKSKTYKSLWRTTAKPFMG